MRPRAALRHNEVPPWSLRAIADRLVQTRNAISLNQSEFANRAGIAKNTYNQWEQAKGRPGLDEAMKLCETYGMTLDWIYRGNPVGLPYEITSELFRTTA